MSAAARTNILNAMLAENARLLANETRVKIQPAPTPKVSFWDQLVRMFNPPVVRTFGGFAAVLLVVVGFVLVGGERGMSVGVVSGGGMLQESRSAFGRTWAIGRPIGDQQMTLHGGDELTAQVTTTIVLTNQSTIQVAPGSRISIAPDGSGVTQLDGEVAYDIYHAPNEMPNFTVQAGAAQMIDRGTRFRTRRGPDNEVVHYTDYGRVSVVVGTDSEDVITGEQIRADDNGLSKVELQTPIVKLSSASNNRALTNGNNVTMTAVIYPNSTLFATDAVTGAKLYEFKADAAGNVTGTLQLNAGEGDYSYRFYVASPDKRESQPSSPVTIVVDRTPPRVALEPLTQAVNEVIVRGSTEPGATVSANGLPAVVNADGSFEVRLPKEANLTVVRLVITDEAGNPRPFEIKVQ